MKLTLLFFFLLAIGFTYSQDDKMDLRLVGPGGGDATSADGKYTFNYSMGELFPTTVRNYNQILTQGFQQGKMIRVVGIEAIENLNWKVEVYPNPVSEFLNVSFDKVRDTKFDIQLYSSNGQLITAPIENMGLDELNKYQIDFRQMTAGSYIVKVWNAQSEKYVGSVSIIKNESVK